MNRLKQTLKIALQIGFLSSLFLMASCNNENTVITQPVFEPIEKPLTELAPEPEVLVWGNYFRSENNSVYRKLLESCRRCGLKRVQPGRNGIVLHTRYYPLSSEDARKCENWDRRGYLQIEFQEKRLPTNVTVTLQPEYESSAGKFWGEPFSVDAEARAINENKGFQIILNPSLGLGGVQNLYISSSGSNHLENSELSVEVSYGGGYLIDKRDVTPIIVQNLRKQRTKSIKEAKYSCSQYVN